MKKFLILFSCIMLFFAASTVPLLAQGVEPPEIEVVMGFGSFAALIALIATVTPFITGVIGKFTSKGWVMQVSAWVIALILTLIGWFANIGFLAGEPILTVIATGVGAGLISNGIFDIKIVEEILKFFGLVKKKE
jgi:hypothetical protein